MAEKGRLIFWISKGSAYRAFPKFQLSDPSFIARLGPKGLPAESVEEVHQAFRKAMEDPEFIKGCETVDPVAIYRNPQDTANFLVHMNEEIIGLVRDLKLPRK